MGQSWIDETVSEIIEGLPARCAVDLGATARIVLLRAAETGVEIDPKASRAAIMEACVKRGRSLSL